MSGQFLPLWRDWNRPLIFIYRARVDLRQLANVKAGGVLLCDGDPHTAVMVVDPRGDYEYVAGMVSEDV